MVTFAFIHRGLKSLTEKKEHREAATLDGTGLKGEAMLDMLRKHGQTVVVHFEHQCHQRLCYDFAVRVCRHFVSEGAGGRRGRHCFVLRLLVCGRDAQAGYMKL